MSDNRIVCLRVASTGQLSRTRHGDEAGSGSDRGTATGGFAAVEAQGAAVRGCATRGCDAADGAHLGAAFARGGWGHRQVASATARTTDEARPGATRRATSDPVEGRVECGIPDRTVDDQARARRDQAALWGRVRNVGMLAAAARARLYATEAGEARAAAQRGRHRHVEATDVAGAKKKSLREGRTIVFIDESGLSEKCPVTRTWAPRGHTPVIQQSFTWKQMPAIAGLSWWRFYFRFFAS